MTGAVPATAPAGVRPRLALALDVDDVVIALRLARELQPWFGVAKVGLELYTAAGPDAVGSLAALGYDVFLDLKLHDIPTTVGRAAAVVGAYGVRYLTLHAMGGVPMLRAGVEGFHRGAERAGLEPPVALAVTVLAWIPLVLWLDRSALLIEQRLLGLGTWLLLLAFVRA